MPRRAELEATSLVPPPPDGILDSTCNTPRQFESSQHLTRSHSQYLLILADRLQPQYLICSHSLRRIRSLDLILVSSGQPSHFQLSGLRTDSPNCHCFAEFAGTLLQRLPQQTRDCALSPESSWVPNPLLKKLSLGDAPCIPYTDDMHGDFQNEWG